MFINSDDYHRCRRHHHHDITTHLFLRFKVTLHVSFFSSCPLLFSIVSMMAGLITDRMGPATCKQGLGVIFPTSSRHRLVSFVVRFFIFFIIFVTSLTRDVIQQILIQQEW